MSIVIQLPNGKNVSFPDGTSQEQIEDALSKSGINSMYSNEQKIDAMQRIATADFSGIQVDESIPEFLENVRPSDIGPYPTYGATPPSLRKNPEYSLEKTRLQEEQVLNDFSIVTGLPKKDIDLTSGLGPGIRSRLSLDKDPDDKLAILKAKYGDKNAIQFPYENKIGYAVRENGKFILVDERGASFNDIFDGTRDIAVTSLELIAPFLGLKRKAKIIEKTVEAGVDAVKAAKTAKTVDEAVDAGTVLQFVMPKTVFSASAKAGGARATGEFGAEIVEDLMNLGVEGTTEDIQVLKPIIDGAVTFGTDMALGKGFELFAKVSRDPSRTGADVEFDELGRSIRELSEKYGIDIPQTFGMTKTRAFSEAEVKLANKGDKYFQEKRELTRNALYQIEEAIKTGNVKQFKEIADEWRSGYEAMLKKASKDVSEQNTFLQRSFDEYTENVLDNLSFYNQTLETSSNNIRNIFQDITTSVDSNVDLLYDTAKQFNASVPEATYLELAETLLASMPNVPKSQQGKILASFLPPNARKILNQSGQLKGQIPTMEQVGLIDFDGNQIQYLLDFDDKLGQAMPTLDWNQLIEMRKTLGSMYSTASKNNIDKKTIADAIKGIDDLMLTKSEQAGGGAFEALQAANSFFRSNKVPLLENKQLNTILKLTPDGEHYANDVIPVIDAVFKKSNTSRFTDLDKLAKLSGDPELFNQRIREYISSRIRGNFTRQGGGISFQGLSNLMNDTALMQKYFSKEVVKDLDYLNKNYNRMLNSLGKTNPDALVIDEALFDDFLSVTDPKVRLELRNKIAQGFSNRNRIIRANKNKVLTELRSDNPNIALNENEILDMIPTMKNADIAELFSFLPDDAVKSIQMKMKSRLIDRARYYSSTTGGYEVGSRRISDGNVLYNTLNDPKLADRWKTILTKEDLQDLNNLAIILRESGEIDKSVQGGLLSFGEQGGETFRDPRYILSGNNSRFYMAVPFDAVITKLQGIAMRTPGFRNLLQDRGAKADKLLTEMIPMILASGEATNILITEMSTDPVLSAYMQEYLKTSDSERNEALLRAIKNFKPPTE